MKKIVTFIIVIGIITTNFGNLTKVNGAFDPDFATSSKAFYMVNLDSGDVVAKKDEDIKLMPASTVKIMTAIVAMENIKSLNQKAEITYDSFNEFSGDNPNYHGPSNAAIEVYQENITYKDLIYSLMIASACESANILAYNLGDKSIPNFINMMNEKAQEIGAENTSFANPHGLYHENNYTTAKDLYLITKYAYDNIPDFVKITNTGSYKMPPNKAYPDGYNIYHTNKMLDSSSQYFYEGVKGIKTGSIDAIGKVVDGEFTWIPNSGSRSLVTIAEKNGYNYMLVTLEGAYKDEDGELVQSAFDDHRKLYNWAFSKLENKRIVVKGESVADIPVSKGKDATVVSANVEEDFSALLLNSIDISTIQKVIVPVSEVVEAPIKKGDSLGILQLNLAGETIATLNLVAKDDVELSLIEDYKEKGLILIKSAWFQASIIILVGLVTIIFTSRSMIKRKKKQQEKMRRRRP